jgi:hypothetical protein
MEVWGEVQDAGELSVKRREVILLLVGLAGIVDNPLAHVLHKCASECDSAFRIARPSFEGLLPSSVHCIGIEGFECLRNELVGRRAAFEFNDRVYRAPRYATLNLQAVAVVPKYGINSFDK